MKPIAALFIALIALIAIEPHAFGQTFDCAFGKSERWGSAWCDFAQPTTIPSGVCIRLGIGGTAHKVVVRILDRGQDPHHAVGLVGGAMPVPNDRNLVVKVPREYPDAVQVSVHGGPAAWDISLGEKNGPVELKKVERITCP